MHKIVVSVMMACGLGMDACRLDAAEPGAPTATDLQLTPRAVERPLMKYRLFPAAFELREGNAAPILLRLPWEQTKYFAEVVPTYQDYLKLPLDDPKIVASEKVFSSLFYGELRRAAYRRDAAWEHPLGEEPVARILLPDVQGARSIAGRGLSVWIRYQISQDELDKAREGILVGLAVSRHYATAPFTIVQLVCSAIDSLMLDRVEELIAHPKSPNLYWALTALPRPILDTRLANEIEQRFLEMSVDGLDDVDRLQSEAEWRNRAEAVVRLYLDTVGIPQPSEAEANRQRERLLSLARKELPNIIEGGAERVAKMSDAEAGLRWYLERHRQQAHESAALSSLEPPAAIPALADLQTRLASFRQELGLATLLVMENPLGIYVSTRRAQRRIDALRAVEAIRHHAARHDGKLPGSLAEIDDPPVPPDIFTGRPFEYLLEPDAAILTAPGVPTKDSTLGTIRYRIRMR